MRVTDVDDNIDLDEGVCMHNLTLNMPSNFMRS